MSLSGGQLAGGNSTTQKAENDFYATDPKTVELFLKKFEVNNSTANLNTILEPACGTGNICKVLRKHFPNAKIEANDLIYRGYGKGGVDFLNYDGNADMVITNPPFSLAKEFIEKALTISNKYVIMLCKIQLLEGISRKSMFETTPLKYVYVHTTRQATWKNGEQLDPNGKKWATTMCMAWFVWDKNYDGEPIIKFI